MTEYAAYLPEVWKDDFSMNSLMSVMKERYVNKVDYDKKLKFWSEVIEASCVGERNAVLNLQTLKRRLRRGDRVPPSLHIVLKHLKESGEVKTLEEWRNSHSGWLGWGLSKTKGWVFGASEDETTEKLVHLPTVRAQADKLIEMYDEHFRDEVEMTGAVVAYAEIYDKCMDFICNTETFDIVLDYLTDSGELSIGNAKNGDKVLKFKDKGSNSPVKFTESDASVIDVRRAMTKVEKEIFQLEAKAKKLDEQCRKSLRSGEKQRAGTFLRQKKRVEKDIADRDGQLQRLTNMLHQIANAKQNKEVIDAYRTGTEIFKSSMERHGLTVEKVDEAMDEVASTMQDYRDIEDAIGASFPKFSNGVDEGELEKELDDLINSSQQTEAKDTSLKLPDVPSSNRFGLPEDTGDDQEILERRLARLRQAI